MPETPINHHESLTELLTAVSGTIAQEFRAGFMALREDKEDRHHVRNVADTAINLATANKLRIEALEGRMTALLGDGTGSNGRIAELYDVQRKTQSDMADVKSDVRAIKDSIADMRGVTEESKSWFSGGRAMLTVLAALTGVMTILGGMASMVLWLYKH